MNKLLEKLGGRKMLLSLLIFIGSTILAYFSKLDQDSYFTLIKYLTLIYIGGNVTQAGLVKKLPNANIKFTEEITDIITEGQSLDQMGGRKFLFILGIYAVSIILLILNTIEAGIYVDIANWLCFVYVGGNVAGKAMQQGTTVAIVKT